MVHLFVPRAGERFNVIVSLQYRSQKAEDFQTLSFSTFDALVHAVRVLNLNGDLAHMRLPPLRNVRDVFRSSFGHAHTVEVLFVGREGGTPSEDAFHACHERLRKDPRALEVMMINAVSIFFLPRGTTKIHHTDGPTYVLRRPSGGWDVEQDRYAVLGHAPLTSSRRERSLGSERSDTTHDASALEGSGGPSPVSAPAPPPVLVPATTASAFPSSSASAPPAAHASPRPVSTTPRGPSHNGLRVSAHSDGTCGTSAHVILAGPSPISVHASSPVPAPAHELSSAPSPAPQPLDDDTPAPPPVPVSAPPRVPLRAPPRLARRFHSPPRAPLQDDGGSSEPRLLSPPLSDMVLAASSSEESYTRDQYPDMVPPPTAPVQTNPSIPSSSTSSPRRQSEGRTTDATPPLSARVRPTSNTSSPSHSPQPMPRRSATPATFPMDTTDADDTFIGREGPRAPKRNSCIIASPMDTANDTLTERHGTDTALQAGQKRIRELEEELSVERKRRIHAEDCLRKERALLEIERRTLADQRAMAPLMMDAFFDIRSVARDVAGG